MLRSGNSEWLFNSDLLEEKYGIFIQDDNYKKMGTAKNFFESSLLKFLNRIKTVHIFLTNSM